MDKVYIKVKNLMLEKKYADAITLLEKKRKLKISKLNEEEISNPVVLLQNKEKEGFSEVDVFFNSDPVVLLNDNLKKGFLFAGCIDENIPLVSQLVDESIDLGVTDNRGKTPLHHATSTGSTELVKLLVDAGANLDSLDSQGSSPFFSMFGYRSKEVDGDYARDLASKRCEVAKLLIERGADYKATNRNGETLVYYAIERGNRDMLNLFISKGLSVNTNDINKSSPLIRVVAIGIPEERMIEFADILLKHGADINYKFNVQGSDKNLYTPLHFAAINNADISRIVEMYIRHGADINALTSYNETPLHLAVKKRKIETVRVLLENGADPTMYDLYGASSLLYAKAFNQSEIESLFPKENYSLYEPEFVKGSENGENLLHVISENRECDSEFITMLLEAGCFIDQREKDGYTPLCLAALWGNYQAAKILLGHGADPNIQTENGKTALDQALSHREEEVYLNIIGLLQEYGGKMGRELDP
ncbi:MAG: ankyrin repeat domain-containing protein [Spirochaetales bacterium]|nr:ankyrin repeat domain-containing protein [Spirochaetales bacterium]